MRLFDSFASQSKQNPVRLQEPFAANSVKATRVDSTLDQDRLKALFSFLSTCEDSSVPFSPLCVWLQHACNTKDRVSAWLAGRKASSYLPISAYNPTFTKDPFTKDAFTKDLIFTKDPVSTKDPISPKPERIRTEVFLFTSLTSYR